MWSFKRVNKNVILMNKQIGNYNRENKTIKKVK